MLAFKFPKKERKIFYTACNSFIPLNMSLVSKIQKTCTYAAPGQGTHLNLHFSNRTQVPWKNYSLRRPRLLWGEEKHFHTGKWSLSVGKPLQCPQGPSLTGRKPPGKKARTAPAAPHSSQHSWTSQLLPEEHQKLGVEPREHHGPTWLPSQRRAWAISEQG